MVMPRAGAGGARGRNSVVLVAASALLLALAGCGDPGAASSAAGSSPAPLSGATGPQATGNLTVFAAASLTEAFDQIGEDFEAAHPGTVVTMNFGSSSALAQQILSGAPADVFASAAPAPMDDVIDGVDGRGDPAVFARNRLQIAVPVGNPGDVRGLADFADPNLTIALCAAQVPCGAAALDALQAAGITPAADTLEQDVKAALSKVRLGEVDAALVYRTDVLAAGDEVEGIAFPESDRTANDYPITVLDGAPHADSGDVFVDYVLSEEGQRVLAEAGFETP